MAARKPYIWAIDAMSDGAGGILFAQLLTVINGCVAPEPTRRLTVPAVLESLTTLQHDVAAAAPATRGGGNGGDTSPVVVPPPPVPGAPVYDVLAIVSALEALSIDASAVIDAIGGMSTSSLDALRTSGVPYVKCFAVKKALATTDGPTVPVKVGGLVRVGPWLQGDAAVPLWCRVRSC